MIFAWGENFVYYPPETDGNREFSKWGLTLFRLIFLKKPFFGDGVEFFLLKDTSFWMPLPPNCIPNRSLFHTHLLNEYTLLKRNKPEFPRYTYPSDNIHSKTTRITGYSEFVPKFNNSCNSVKNMKTKVVEK